ncbi:MAG: extracellular solute-binding protein [Actinomycetota bacterium]
MSVRTRRILVLGMACAVAAVTASCASGSAARHSTMTLYTCASANVEQAVVSAFEKAHSGTKIDVFRAPTGQLNARIAADARSGGLRPDVIWACDPLTMHGYDEQGLLAPWAPANAAEIPSAYRTPHFVGVDLLYMVLAIHKGLPPPATYAALTARGFKDSVALPNPSFAASALGMLGYFASAPGYGMTYYQQLKSNGAVQVNSPSDALTGVERGTYRAAFTLANAAYLDQKKGSPIEVVWPKPGGIAIYAPIGVTTKKDRSPLATQFASYAASRDGQKLMAGQGTYVPIDGLGGPPIPAGSPIVSPEWSALFAKYKSVLADYVALFGS